MLGTEVTAVAAVGLAAGLSVGAVGVAVYRHTRPHVSPGTPVVARAALGWVRAAVARPLGQRRLVLQRPVAAAAIGALLVGVVHDGRQDGLATLTALPAWGALGDGLGDGHRPARWDVPIPPSPTVVPPVPDRRLGPRVQPEVGPSVTPGGGAGRTAGPGPAFRSTGAPPTLGFAFGGVLLTLAADLVRRRLRAPGRPARPSPAHESEFTPDERWEPETDGDGGPASPPAEGVDRPEQDDGEAVDDDGDGAAPEPTDDDGGAGRGAGRRTPVAVQPQPGTTAGRSDPPRTAARETAASRVVLYQAGGW
ncbi:MAG: hypothetical protein JWO98_1036 [Frankiales bacterium]|nr:hypothetical protein [Frankiales bacterium]